jgi:DNA-binding MurR/RpiR family transcriptional regulator
VPYRLLVQQLDRHFASLSPELQRAARWVREHPAELGLQSMRQSARAAGVSPATMTRLAQALDFGGFDAMRRPAMAALAQSVGRPEAKRLEPATEDRANGSASALQPAQAANVASALARNPAHQLLAAARSILAARQVLFLGLRASFGIAHHLRYSCDWLRPGTALATDPGGAWADQLAELGSSDLLVAVSQAPYTVQTVQAAQQLRARGVPVLALTDSALSPLAREAATVLLFDTASASFFHSQVGAQALSEALMATVAEQGGAAVLQRLAERQQRLQAAQVYWDKPTRRAANA